jgi:hypothetical protein
VLLDHGSHVRDVRKSHALEDRNELQQLAVVRVTIPRFDPHVVLRFGLPLCVALLVHNHYLLGNIIILIMVLN